MVKKFPKLQVLSKCMRYIILSHAGAAQRVQRRTIIALIRTPQEDQRIPTAEARYRNELEGTGRQKTVSSEERIGIEKNGLHTAVKNARTNQDRGPRIGRTPTISGVRVYRLDGGRTRIEMFQRVDTPGCGTPMTRVEVAWKVCASKHIGIAPRTGVVKASHWEYWWRFCEVWVV